MDRAAAIELIERTTGIVLMPEHVQRRLTPFAGDRARALGLASSAAYLEQLAIEPVSGAEWRRVIAALTNGQTSFFRDPEQFDAIADVLRARSRAAGARPLAIWSAGCSTGEEPYSLAILTLEMGIRARILATDLNAGFLDRARAGCYGPWALRRVDAARRAAWFDEIPGGFRVKPRVRERVELACFNLVRDRPPASAAPGGRWDVILCRNVFLYFNRERMGQACERLTAALAESGRLFVAASETLHGLGLPVTPEIIGTRIAYRVSADASTRQGIPARPERPLLGTLRDVVRPEAARPGHPAALRPGHPAAARPGHLEGNSGQPATNGAAPSAPVPRGPHPGVGPLLSTLRGLVKGGSAVANGRAGAPQRAPAKAPGDRAEPDRDAPAARGLRPIIDRVAALADAGKLADARALLERGHGRPAGGADGVVFALTRGHLDLREHDLSSALSAYNDAAEIDSLLPEIHYFQGLVHRKRGTWSEAADAFRRALFLAPSFWQASYLLSGAFERLASPHAAARERARTHRCLTDPAPPMTFLSHPLFVRWFGVDEAALRRLMRLPPQ